jgi:hypothetical protein
MGKKQPTPPPAPDYAAAATAQGQANIAAGQQTASLSNPNVVSPYGNQSVSYAPTGPNGAYQPTVTQSLTPEAQAALTAQQQEQMQMAQLGQQSMTAAQQAMATPFQYTGPGIQTSLGNQQQALTDMGAYGTATGMGGYQNAQTTLGPYGQVQGSLDLSNVANMPVNAGTTGQAALMARLQPQINQGDAAFTQQLANQGIGIGSEAYNNAMRAHGQQNNDLTSQAALYGINLDMSANQQGYGEALQSGQFANAAQGQQYQEQLGAGQFANAGIAQNYAQQMNATELANQAVAQNYGQQLNAAQFTNQGIAQNYNQALQSAQFGNTAAAQALQQQLALYNQPINQAASLMSGSQIQAPQFQQYSGAQIQAAPVANATAQLGQYQQGLYGQQMAGYNAGMQALGSAVGSAAGLYAMSDVRLKSNIVRVSTHPLGIGVYEYDIFGQRVRGVMAHEVEAVRPDAVAMHPSGYKMVNYGALN